MLRELDNHATAGRTLSDRSVRAIDDADFAAIVNGGLVDTRPPEHAARTRFKAHRCFHCLQDDPMIAGEVTAISLTVARPRRNGRIERSAKVQCWLVTSVDRRSRAPKFLSEAQGVC
jgi:hypothetical protein